MKQPALADALALSLLEHGVTQAFGIPGIHNLKLFTSFVQQGIDVVTTRHEQGAAFMCDGYARASGRPAACLVIDGPGFLNASTGIAQASGDSSPLIVVTPAQDRASSPVASGRIHELEDQLQISRQICRASFEITDADSLASAVEGAFSIFNTMRPGAIHMQVPMSAVSNSIAAAPQPRPVSDVTPMDGDTMQSIARARELLDAAERPLLLVGGGAVDAAEDIHRLASTLDAPCINTTNAKGILPKSSPYRVGGSPSLKCIRDAISQADVVLAVGTEFGETDYDMLFLQESVVIQRLIRIDADPDQLLRNISADVAICGRATQVLPAIQPTARNRDGAQSASALRDSIRQEPHFRADYGDFFQLMVEATDVLVSDSAQPSYFAVWMYEPEKPRSYFHSASGFGTLGFGIPAAIGAKLARPESRVSCLVGDGGAQFTISELAVASDLGLGMPFLVWDNSAYKEIDKALAAENILKHTGYRRSPDFRMLAKGFGCAHAAPRNHEELASVIAEAHERSVPTVVAVAESRFVSNDQENWYL